MAGGRRRVGDIRHEGVLTAYLVVIYVNNTVCNQNKKHGVCRAGLNRTDTQSYVDKIVIYYPSLHGQF